MSSTNITVTEVSMSEDWMRAANGMFKPMTKRDSFGRRLYMMRRDMKLTQSDVIERLARMGITIGQTYMSTLENSDDRTPTGEVVAGLARVLETNTDYLLMLSDDPLPVAKRNEVESIGISPQAEELARIADRLPPFRRDELLAHARTIEQMERESERDVKAAMDALTAQLRTGGLILGDDAVRAVQRSVLDFVETLLGTNAVATVDALAINGESNRSRRKAKP